MTNDIYGLPETPFSSMMKYTECQFGINELWNGCYQAVSLYSGTLHLRGTFETHITNMGLT